ncbi:hypothetical protein [Flaviaesturariibacter amylovorans]|uniref:CopG family transcriptional regulator n=1 Tax=Flaviaesturariibacter amylovorans TaxID=1084520 RepID=A0ABP8GQ41_9BACT
MPNEEKPKGETTIQRKFYLDKEVDRKLKVLIAIEGKSASEFANDTFSKAIKAYEAKHGPIPIK